MRKLPLIIILLSLSAWAYQQPVIQAVSSGPGNTSRTCAGNSSTAKGFPHDVLNGSIVIAIKNSESSIGGISDTRGDLTAVSGSPVVSATNTNGVFTTAWVAKLTSSGPETITFANATNFDSYACMELDGNQYTTTVDVSNTLQYASGGTHNFPSMTTTVDGDFVVAYVGCFQNSGYLVPTAPLKWFGSTSGGDCMGAAYEVAGTNGTVTPQFTNVGSLSGSGVEFALKPVSITIVDASLPTASTTGAYSYTLSAINGVGAYTWSISSGSLPTGFSISSSTGSITGTPSTGTSTFTVQVVGATSGTATKSFTLTVNSSANTPSFVQGGGYNGSPYQVSLTSVAVGDVLVQSCYTSDDSNDHQYSPPSDTLNTPFTIVGAVNFIGYNSGQTVDLTVYIGTAISSGADTVTSKSTGGCATSQLSNVQGISDIFVVTNGNTATPATVTSNNITTPSPNSMVYAAAIDYTAAATLSAVAPFTSDGGNCAANCYLAEYKLEATVAAYAPQFSYVNNTQANGAWAIVALALRPTTTGTVVPPYVPNCAPFVICPAH